MTFSHTLVYIRHGQTDWNVEARLQGQRDIPLNDTGRLQARRNGAVLAEWLARDGLEEGDFDWVASPLSRARETMELVRASAGLAPVGYRACDTLKEVSFGAWESLTLKEVARRDPEGHAARRFDKWGFVPPGGESYAMLTARIARWVERIDRDTVCVAHGAVHRVLRHLLEGVPPAEAPALDVPQDRVYLWHGGAPGWA